MTLWTLVLKFLYIGLFTVGGGLASIPLILEQLVYPGIISEDFFYSMVAVSESTPGPIGVNLATYIGYSNFGFFGGVLATFGVVLPCFIIAMIVSKFMEKFSSAKIVKAAFYGIKACVCGLIATAAWQIMQLTLFNVERFQSTGVFWQLFNPLAILVFAALILIDRFWKKPPYVLIGIGAVLGILLL